MVVGVARVAPGPLLQRGPGARFLKKTARAYLTVNVVAAVFACGNLLDTADRTRHDLIEPAPTTGD